MLQDLDVPDRLYPGFVYVLRLEDDCLYVGYTLDPEVRIASHFMGRGAQWTASFTRTSGNQKHPTRGHSIGELPYFGLNVPIWLAEGAWRDLL